MKNKILWTTAILPLFISVIAIQFMEDKVPLHYDIKGNINRWGSKYEELIFPCIIIVFTIISIIWRQKQRMMRRNNMPEIDS